MAAWGTLVWGSGDWEKRVMFPTNPGLNQEETLSNGFTYKWDGEFWVIIARPNGGGTPVGNLAGDVTGPITTTIVEAIRGRAVASSAPTAGQQLVWADTPTPQWAPTSVSVGGVANLAGDVTGPVTATVLSNIQGREIENYAPQRGQVYVWETVQNRLSWTPSGPYLKAADHWGSSAHSLEILSNLRVGNDITLPVSGRIGTVQTADARPNPPEDWSQLVWYHGLGWTPSGPSWPRRWSTGGDIYGTLGSTRVVGIANTRIGAGATTYPPQTEIYPQIGQVLTWNVTNQSPNQAYWSPSGPYLKSSNRWGDQIHYLRILQELTVDGDIILNDSTRIGQRHGQRPYQPSNGQALCWRGNNGLGWTPSGPFWEISWGPGGDVGGTLGNVRLRSLGGTSNAIGGPRNEYPPRALNPTRKQALIWNNEGSTNPNNQFWTPSGPYLQSANIWGNQAYNLQINNSGTTDPNYPGFMCLDISTFERMIYARGGIQTPGGSVGSISDARTKDDVAAYRRGIAEIRRLQPISYRYNGRGGTPKDGNTYHGFNAEDVQQIIPEMIAIQKGKLDRDDKDDADILTVNNGPLLYAVVNALKELEARIARLEGPTPTSATPATPTPSTAQTPTGRVGTPPPRRK